MNPTIKARIESIRRGEVPEGYKRTKIGIVPNEWVTNVTLKSICTINPKTEQLPDQFIYIDLESVVDGVLVSKKIIKKSNAPSRAQRVLQVNDVIYQMVRPYQRNNYLFCHESKCYKYVASTGYAQLRAKCYAFLYYLINSDYFCAQVLEKCTGSNYPAINSEDLASISITYPKKEAEQQKIAEILAGQDRVIALKEKLLAEKQKQKKYLMQQLLTAKKRLPGFSGEWKKSLLGDLFRERVETNCTELRLLAITGGQGVIPRDELELKDNSSEDKSKYKKICVGDIGYNTMRMWQGVSAFSNYEGIVSPAYTILMPNSEIDAKFFAYLFKLPSIIFLFYRYSQGLVDDTRNLKYENLKRIRVLFPQDKKEQSAIAEILSTADKEIELLKKDIEQEKLKKKSLMQLLLTGIVRVDELVS